MQMEIKPLELIVYNWATATWIFHATWLLSEILASHWLNRRATILSQDMIVMPSWEQTLLPSFTLTRMLVNYASIHINAFVISQNKQCHRNPSIAMYVVSKCSLYSSILLPSPISLDLHANQFPVGVFTMQLGSAKGLIKDNAFIEKKITTSVIKMGRWHSNLVQTLEWRPLHSTY